MQYYDVALEHLSDLDLESFRSILPGPIHPFVLLSYPIRSDRPASGNESSSSGSGRYSQGYQHQHHAQRVYGDDEGYDVGPSATGSYRSATTAASSAPAAAASSAIRDCPSRTLASSYRSSFSSSSHAPCGRLAIPHPSTHPHNLFYDKGPNDALFVVFWAVTFTILREALMRWAYMPFVRWHLSRLDRLDREKDDKLRVREKKGDAGGEERLSKKEQKLRDRVIVRFAEQAWTCTYASVFWSLGMYILHLVPTNPFSSQYLWHNYPHTPLSPLTKFYYLVQLGFWFHQLFIFNLEARRKDYYQMLTHHFVTIALVMGSYWANYTRVGTVILVLMDFCDIWLPLAKLFRYLRLPTLTDLTFVVFLISWLITRQIGFSLVTLSCIFRARYILPRGWHPDKGQYANAWVINGFPALLVVLLIMNCIWFWMACNVAWRVVMGLGAEDTRSDDEEDIPESDADMNDGPNGDLVSSKGTDEVHPKKHRGSCLGSKDVKDVDDEKADGKGVRVTNGKARGDTSG